MGPKVAVVVKPLYIVRTNYNRPQDEAFLPDASIGEAALRVFRGDPQSDLADDFAEGYIGHAPNFHERNGRELEKEIQKHRPGKPIVPCVEFEIGWISFHSDVGGMQLDMPYDDGYDVFKRKLMLLDQDMQQWTRRLPEGMEYFDLILDYPINLEKSAETISRLKQDPEFEVREIEIRRKPFE